MLVDVVVDAAVVLLSADGSGAGVVVVLVAVEVLEVVLVVEELRA